MDLVMHVARPRFDLAQNRHRSPPSSEHQRSRHLRQCSVGLSGLLVACSCAYRPPDTGYDGVGQGLLSVRIVGAIAENWSIFQ